MDPDRTRHSNLRRYLSLFGVLLLISFSVGCSDDVGYFVEGKADWEVEVYALNGWGVDSASLYANSNQQLGFMESSSDALPVKKYCDNLSLSSRGAQQIASSIEALEQAIPDWTILRHLGRCSDEPNIYVTVRSGDSVRGFSYSALEQCREQNDIPVWSFKLVEAIEEHRNAIESCEASEVDQDF